MRKKIKDLLKLRIGKRKKIRKNIMLGMLAANEFCISFNKEQDIEIWNYMLR